MGKRGNTMVEVMVSFVVLAMLAGIFANIVFVSGQTARKTEKKLEADSRFLERYYLDEGIRREKAGGGRVVFYRIFDDGRMEPGEYFSLSQMEVYRCVDEEGGQEAVYDVMP